MKLVIMTGSVTSRITNRFTRTADYLRTSQYEKLVNTDWL